MSSQHSALEQLLPAQLDVGNVDFTLKPASHEPCWKPELPVELQLGFASQHSELVQLLPEQLDVGNVDFALKPASHEPC